MSRIIFIFSILFLTACSDNSEITNELSKNKKLPCACDSINIVGQIFPDSLCGIYGSKPYRNGMIVSGTGITFYSNMTYRVLWGDWETSGRDSGRITFKNNIVSLYSCLHLVQTDSTSEEIVPQTGVRYLIKGKRLFIVDKKDSLDRVNFMLKSGQNWTKDISLDTDGDGYAEEVNAFGQVTSAGQYRNHKLGNGFRFFYDGKNKMVKVLNYDLDLEGKGTIDTITGDELISNYDKHFNGQK